MYPLWVKSTQANTSLLNSISLIGYAASCNFWNSPHTSRKHYICITKTKKGPWSTINVVHITSLSIALCEKQPNIQAVKSLEILHLHLYIQYVPLYTHLYKLNWLTVDSCLTLWTTLWNATFDWGLWLRFESCGRKEAICISNCFSLLKCSSGFWNISNSHTLNQESQKDDYIFPLITCEIGVWRDS